MPLTNIAQTIPLCWTKRSPELQKRNADDDFDKEVTYDDNADNNFDKEGLYDDNAENDCVKEDTYDDNATNDYISYIIFGFLINVQGHHPHQWAPFQVTG